MINEKYGNFVRLHQSQAKNCQASAKGNDCITNYTFAQTEVLQLEAYCSTLSLKLQEWTAISLSLFKQNRQYCFHFLQYLQKNQLNKPIYGDFIYQNAKINVYNNLFAMCLARSSGIYQKNNNDYLTNVIQSQFGLNHSTPKQQSQKFYQMATKYLGHSQNVKQIRQRSMNVGRGFLLYYNGEMDKAFNSFNISANNSDLPLTGENINDQGFKAVALIGLAQVSFQKRKYHKALQYYKKALQTYKTLPIKARIGMAYSFFYCEKYEMAQACFKRLLKLNQNCVEAYIGLAIIQEKNQNYEQYFKLLSQAYKINKNHPLLLLHLAQHYLFKGQYQKSQQFAQKGLAILASHGSGVSKFHKQIQVQGEKIRNDNQQIRGRLNNIIGQTHHIRQNFDEALKYYKLSSSIIDQTGNKYLNFNEILLAQVYTHPTYQNYIQALRILQKIFKNSSQSTAKLYYDCLRQIGYLKSKIPQKIKNLNENTEDQGVESTQYYYNQAIKYNKNQIQVKIQLANILSQTHKFRTLRLLQSVLSTDDQQQSVLMNKVKIELLNNIGVLLLQNGQIQQAMKHLQRCCQQLSATSLYKNLKSTNELQNQTQDQVKNCSLQLICFFNLAITYQKLFQTEKAKQIYRSILSKNVYFIDASIRLGYILFRQGKFNESIAILDEAFKLSELPILVEKAKLINLRFDKVPSMKAYLYNQAGQSSKAKEVLKQNFKIKDAYTQIQELSIFYQSLMKRQLQIVQLKDFLRPNRQLYMKYCHDDPNSAFGYMVLCILLLTDKRVSKQQGLDLFTQLKQHSSNQIPIILFNMGLFLFKYDDYDNCPSIFQAYKEATLDSRADQILSLTNLLKGQYDKSLSCIKKNIMMDPSNIKYRFQMIYAYEKKCQKSTQNPLSDQKNQFNRQSSYNIGSTLSTSNLQLLKKCQSFYIAFSRLNMNDYIKLYDSPDFKQRVKNNCMKVKSFSDQRRIYASSNISYHEKFQKDIEQKQKAQKQWKRVNIEKLKNASLAIKPDIKVNKIAQEEQGEINKHNQLDQEEDSEQIRIRKKQEKKRKALQMAKQKEISTQQKWEQLKEKQQQNQKVKRQRDPKKKSTSTKKKQKKRQSQDERQVPSQDEKSMSPSISNPYDDQIQKRIQDDQVQAPKRSRKQKERQRQRHRERKRIKKERNNSQDSDIDYNRKQKQNQQNEERLSQESSRDRKRDKKEEAQEDEIDIDTDKYLI